MVKDALHTSLVERDLMRMYIKQLYESTFEEFNNVKEQVKPIIKQSEKITEPIKPAVIINESIDTPFFESSSTINETKSEPVKEIQKNVVEIEIKKVAPQEIVPPKPQLIEIEKQVEVKEEILIEKETPALIPTQSTIDNEPQKEANSQPETITEPYSNLNNLSFVNSEAYIKLFEYVPATELADKLSNYPISDLKKAFSINDRIQIIHSLFKNDAQTFDESLNLLNNFKTFDEAKTFITKHIIQRFNWLDPDKLNIAKAFISLVRRRYQ